MKILFVGLGSIGRRHLRNLTDVLKARNVEAEIHALRGTGTPLPDDVIRLVHQEFNNVADIDDVYDAIFITNPTVLHYDTLSWARSKAKKIFLEKPVFAEVPQDKVVANLPANVICYVAAPMRYTRVFQYLKRYIPTNEVISARAICSSYLPEWRPGTDYRKCYSASKAKGGDIGIELIHEWDYLTDLFGMPEQVNLLSGKFSQLEIDSDDIALYLGQYKDKVVSLSLDYFGRIARREIEFYLPDEVIVGDFIKSEIRYLKSGKIVSLKEDRDVYQRAELEYFLDLQNEAENVNSVKHAVEVLKIAKGEWPK